MVFCLQSFNLKICKVLAVTKYANHAMAPDLKVYAALPVRMLRRHTISRDGDLIESQLLNAEVKKPYNL